MINTEGFSGDNTFFRVI
ncbi:hypothetical protein D047_1514A, partial [Vibrio parahaemolyticus VPTS-2010_2]